MNFQQHLNERWRRPYGLLNHNRELLREEEIFVHVDRSRYTWYIIGAYVWRCRCRWNINIFTPLRFLVCVTTPSCMGWKSTLLVSVVSNDTSRAYFRSQAYAQFIILLDTKIQTIPKPRIFIENMIISKFQLWGSVNAIFVDFVYPSI